MKRLLACMFLAFLACSCTYDRTERRIQYENLESDMIEARRRALDVQIRFLHRDFRAEKQQMGSASFEDFQAMRNRYQERARAIDNDLAIYRLMLSRVEYLRELDDDAATDDTLFALESALGAFNALLQEKTVDNRTSPVP